MKTIFTLLFGLIISPIMFAQYLNWENITNTKMLTSLYNDGDTLWIGTFGGLIKYNKKTGDSFCYNRANAGLPSNCILGLAKDSKQNLWIANRFNGIGCFKAGLCKTYNRINTDMPFDEYCQGIYVDKNDTIFFGPLYTFNKICNNHHSYVDVNNSLTSIPQYIKNIIPSTDGSLVLATSYGLYNYKNGQYTLMNNMNTDCNVARYDKLGNLWVGTATKGLYKFDTYGNTYIYNSTNSVCPSNIMDSYIDKNNNVWIAGGLKLINFKESGNSETFNINITKDLISSLSYDDTCVWVGTAQHGLYRFSNNEFHKVEIVNQGLISTGPLGTINSSVLLGGIQFNESKFTTLFDTLSGLKTNPFSGMKVWKNKGIFTFGDKTTLGYFENGTWRYYDEFKTDYVKAIAPISLDTFWVSTSNRGLLKYENGQVSAYNTTNSLLPNNNLNALTFDGRGILWGSFGLDSGTPGIFSFDGITWHSWTETEVPYLTYPATTIKFDSQNNLWCNSLYNINQTLCKGLIRYDGSNWSQYDTSNSLLPTNAIYNIFIDNTDTVWTAGVGGAAKFDRENKWEAYTIYNSGMAFMNAQDVVRLPTGDVYFSHTYGGVSVLKNNTTLKNNTPSLSASADLNVYPIPAQDMLTIELPANCSAYKIEIYDLTTKPLYLSAWHQSNLINNLQTINTSLFPKGIYLLQLKTEKKIYLKKVIIK